MPSFFTPYVLLLLLTSSHGNFGLGGKYDLIKSLFSSICSSMFLISELITDLSLAKESLRHYYLYFRDQEEQ